MFTVIKDAKKEINISIKLIISGVKDLKSVCMLIWTQVSVIIVNSFTILMYQENKSQQSAKLVYSLHWGNICFKLL